MIKTFTALSLSAITAVGLGVSAEVATAAGPARECSASQLTARIVAGSPGAGNRYATLTLTNGSKSTCRTGGYPGLGLESAQGRPLPTRAVRTEQSEVHTVILASGHSATSQLHWGAVQSNRDKKGGSCFVAPRRILVTPPNSRQSLDLRWTQGIVCEAGTIDLTPLTLG